MTETVRVVVAEIETDVVEVGYAQPAGNVLQISGDLGGVTSAVQVIATHLVAPLPPAQGGAGVFSPLAYGAAGDGTTNDDSHVHDAFSAAAAAGGIVDLGHYTFLTSTAIPLTNHIHVRGSAQGACGLVNNTTDLFSVTGTVQQFTFEDCSLTASAGHVFNCASGSFAAFGRFKGVVMNQQNSGYGIWYMPSGTYINMLVGDGCSLICSPAAAVAPWLVTGLANSNTWSSLRVTAGTSVTVPFFWIECDSSNAFSASNAFRDITAEMCVAGIISALTVSNLTIENVCGYDASVHYTASLFYVGAGSGGGRSQDITVRNSGRIGGTLGTGTYDFQAAASSKAILLENVGPESSTSSYSVPAAYATIIGGEDNPGYLQTGSLTAVGIAPSPAPARLIGGSTITGAPASGTWNALDVKVDSAGTIWVCTVAGTPGTWVPVQPTSSVPLPLAKGGTGLSAGSGAALLTSLGAAVTAPGMPQPVTRGYAGWLSDPFGGTRLGVPGSTTWAAGNMYFLRADVVPSATVNGYISFQWQGIAGMANSYFSVWTISGTTLTLVGSTADLSALATGYHRVPVMGFVSYVTPASGILYVSYMNGTSGVAGGPFEALGAWATAPPTISSLLPPGTAGQYSGIYDNAGTLTQPGDASPYNLAAGSIGKVPFWWAVD